MKAVIITSNHLRHLAYAKMLCDRMTVSKVFIDPKPASMRSTSLQEKEREYFPKLSGWLPSSHIICARGEINSPGTEQKIRKEGPDIIFVFGSSLLKENIFSIPKIGCINIHTGLVQYYRGVDSSFWALYDERPDRIGATVHFIDKSIDAGEIIFQGRPDTLSRMDDLDDVFLKNCICGFNLVCENLETLMAGNIETRHLIEKGKLYQIKDKKPEKIAEVKAKLSRILGDYCD